MIRFMRGRRFLLLAAMASVVVGGCKADEADEAGEPVGARADSEAGVVDRGVDAGWGEVDSGADVGGHRAQQFVCKPPPVQTGTLAECAGQLPERMPLTFDQTPVQHGVGARVDYALALGATGCPQIGYASETDRTIYFGRWDGSRWVVEEVGPGIEGSDVKFAFDAGGRPWVVYVSDGTIKYATRDEAGGWHEAQVIEVSRLQGFESGSHVRQLQLDFDCAGEPVIAVSEVNGAGKPQGLVYLEQGNGVWRQTLVSEDHVGISYAKNGYEPGWLTVGPDGAAYLFGVDGTQDGAQRIAVFRRENAASVGPDAWNLSEFIAGEAGGSERGQDLVGSTWLGFDGAENARLLYSDDDLDGVWEFRRGAAGWAREAEPVLAAAYPQGALLESPSGRLYFFYATAPEAGEGAELRYARSDGDGDGWHTEGVGPLAGVDADTMLELRVAVDWENGTAHVIAIMQDFDRRRGASYEVVYFHAPIQPESPQPESPQPESPQPESPQPESPQPESP